MSDTSKSFLFLEEQTSTHVQPTLASKSGSASITSTRRRFMLTAAAAAAYSSMGTRRRAHAAIVQIDTANLPPLPLPAGIRSRYVSNINGLSFHVLEAGFEEKGRPCVLLLHGYPELAYGWRKVMPALAAAGYHVIAPDQRGYGRTTGWDASYDGDLNSFRLLNLVRDALGLVSAFGYRSVASVVRHDLGSSLAPWCAPVRPDVFQSVALMSAPFAGPPLLPFDTANAPPRSKLDDPVHRELAALPRPRKDYQWYYSTRQANADMHHAPQGVHDFLRA